MPWAPVPSAYLACMTYDEFIARVAERAGTSPERAADLTRATLLTLNERISGGEARDLASQLPQDLKKWLVPTSGGAEAFDVEDFKRRVRERAKLSDDEAERGIRAVFAVLGEAVTSGEFDDVLSQLPSEFRELVPA